MLGEKAQVNAVRKSEESGRVQYYPLSSAQKRLYVLSQYEGVGNSYNIPNAVIVEGDLDRERLGKALDKIIRRHESLRTSFEMINGEPVQKIHTEFDFEISYFEILESELKDTVEAFIKPFDLSKAPLLRVCVIKLAERRYALVLDMHNIIADKESSNILLSEIAELYRGMELLDVGIQYKDFTVWQNRLLKSDVIKKQEAYWKGIFKDDLPVLNMPTDFSRPAVQSFEGDRLKFEITRKMTNELRKLILKTGSNLYAWLLAAYNTLLFKYTGQEDIIVGLPIAGRSQAALAGVVGMFVNTVALRNYPKGKKTFLEFVDEVKESVDYAHKNQDYPFEKLLDILNIQREKGRNPLFDTMLIMQNINFQEIELENLKFLPCNFEKMATKFDFTLEVIERNNLIKFSLEYSTKLFKRETMERFAEHFVNILKEVLKNPQVELQDIQMMSEEERQQVLFDFNRTEAIYPSDKTMQELFEERVEQTPDNIALVFKDEKLTYRQLNSKANQIARLLRDKGVRQDSIVAIMAERSPEMLIGIFGILKAGGAYLPIDPTHPEERINYVLEDSGANLLLTQSHLTNKINIKGDVINLDDESLYLGDASNLKVINTPTSLAYIIYTSGSTGKPKGVMIEHRSAVNIILALQKEYPLMERDAYLFKTTYTFDVSVAEIFGWFLGNGRLVILESGLEKDPRSILKAIDRNDITHINFVPSMLNVFVNLLTEKDVRIVNKLKYIFAAGEAISRDLIEKFYALTQKVRLENLYGPTETTIYATGYELSKLTDEVNVPIGKPLQNTKTYIIDKVNNPQPVGIAGELCISGDGLARGYLNREELTAEKFVPNPFVSGEKMYRTGDLVRWLPDGNIEFLGRIDHQVKIRGYRIELGEIEEQLLKHESIRQAVVIAREDKSGSKYLCAYIISNNETSILELRKFLAKELPSYMIPAYFVRIEKMPLTTSGKVDRKALPEPEQSISAGENYVAPRNKLEEKIQKVWKEILELEQVGVYDNFFAIGGNSLKAIQVVSELAVDFEININNIFQYQTIDSLVSNIAFKEDNLRLKLERVKESINLAERNDTPEVIADLAIYDHRNKKYNKFEANAKKSYKNVLLTGSTGYLGVHLLNEILRTTDCDLYLLVRGINVYEARERLRRKLDFYFGKGFYGRYKERMHIFNGELTKEYLGLKPEDYFNLANKIDCIINSAANVKHYGEYSGFYEANVKGTERVVGFARTGIKKDLHHISTISVATGKVGNKEKVLFTEYDHDIGQKADNYYAQTKLEAEMIMLRAREEGLNTNIYRVGTLVSDSMSGVFQENIGDNAFYTLIKSLIKLKLAPEVEDEEFDFSFIDQVSTAIILLAWTNNLESETHHIFNPNKVSFAKLAKLVSESGFDVKSISYGEFIDYLYDNYERQNLKIHIENFLLHSYVLEGLDETKFIMPCDKTNMLLKKLNYEWPKVNKEHIKNMLRYCENVNFL